MPASVILPTMPQAQPLAEAVLFAFDEWAFPFRSRVQLHLSPPQKMRLVLTPGPPGSHDEVVLYYGTVLRIEGRLHLWYFGSYGEPPGYFGRPNCVLCYATSEDGVHWDKPDLGLVEFNGSRHNNIVNLPDPGLRTAAAILYEPDDTERPYKLAYEAAVNGQVRFCVAFSRDGLRWQPSPFNPVGPFFEMTGVTRFGGLYYVTGQGPLTAHRPLRARQLFTFASADFEHWSPCGAVGLDRSPDVIGPSTEADWNHVEEIHLGAALWNRGNVILGIYGQWHGHPSGDRRLVTMDLGLALSHDALHYHEPIPGFKFIPAREQPGSPPWDSPALMQGQGMENIGDETCYWYSLWRGTDGTGVRLATWPRDRLGTLKPFSAQEAQVITCPIQIREGGRAHLFANASGLGDHSHLRFELLDEGFRPIPGNADVWITTDGLRIPLGWSLSFEQNTVRLAVHFEGLRPEDCRLHALYIISEE